MRRPKLIEIANAAKACRMVTNDRAHGLDTLRGCAVLAVVAFHYLNNTSVFRVPGLELLQDWSYYLFCGVDLFFVLSGFFIGSSLMRARGRPGYLTTYFVHRACRILPLYYLWLAAFFGLVALGVESRGGAFPWLLQNGALPLWSFVVFGQNIASGLLGGWGPNWLGITWTLALEMHFYVIAALVVAVTPNRYLAAVSIAIILAVGVFKQIGPQYLTGQGMLTLTPARLDAPFFGVLCAWLWSNDDFERYVTRHARAVQLFAVALLLAHYSVMTLGFAIYPIPSLTMNAIVCATLVIAFAPKTSALPNLVVRGLRWCGVRCYAIYLFHVGLLGLASHWIFSWPPNVFPPGIGWPAILVAAPATIILAAVSWRLIERPLIEWSGVYARR